MLLGRGFHTAHQANNISIPLSLFQWNHTTPIILFRLSATEKQE